MVRANELRLGNYVYDTKGHVNTVGWEALNYAIREEHNQIKPIPLTEEWLLKFGFNKIDHHRFKIKPSIFDWYYTYSTHDNAFRYYVNDVIICIATVFEVHQLQNLYFALTNTELTINNQNQTTMENQDASKLMTAETVVLMDGTVIENGEK